MEHSEVGRYNDGDKDFWDRHVLLSQEFKGTDNKYCRELKLDRKKFSYYKRLLGFGRPRQKRKSFVEVKTQPFQLVKSVPMAAPKFNKQPDPKWCAEFLRHFLSYPR